MKYMIIFLALLSGCARFSGDELAEQLENIRGKDIKTAVLKLGVPRAERQIDDFYVYSWGFSHNRTDLVVTPSTTNGFIGSTAFGSNTFTTTPVTNNRNCLIEIYFNKDNIIKGWEFDGNDCQYYVDSLKGS